jgi:cytochrome c-type biogenesis protein CcmH
LATSAAALQQDELLADPTLERRARAISGELRCLVCQNQSIDDSDAPLARDLRLLVRDRLKAGESDGEIRDFVVRRYGEFVLLRPVWALHTALLWVGPLLMILGAAAGLVMVRRRVRGATEAPLTPEEEARIRALTRPQVGEAVTPLMAARES